MRRWFLPSTPDVLQTLRRQAATTVGGVAAFAAWSQGDLNQAQPVKDAEHAADDDRRELLTQLRAAFSLPLDAEDIYELSERLDRVLNGVKNAVREAEVMELRPDAHLAAMAGEIAGGVGHLMAAFDALTLDNDLAIAEADSAIKCRRSLERAYRQAMSDALQIESVRELFGRRELYRRYARVGDNVVAVAERVWYAVVKHV